MNPTGEKFDPFDPPTSVNAEEMSRLVRALSLTDRFAVFIVTCNRADLRDQLIAEVKSKSPNSRFSEMVVTKKLSNLLPYLSDLPSGDDAPDAVFVYGLENFLPDTDEVAHSRFVVNLNGVRDAFPRYLSCPLVLWIPDYVRNGILKGAPDFYSVRSASFVFHTPSPLPGAIKLTSERAEFDSARRLTPAEREQQRKEIQDLLSQTESFPDIDQDLFLRATLFDRLAGLYAVSGDFVEAEVLLRKAIDITERLLEVGHPERATELNNLAYILTLQGKTEEAEVLYSKALERYERVFGTGSREVGIALNNLGNLNTRKGNLVEAERLLRRALSVQERTVGHEHPETLLTRSNLGFLRFRQGNLSESEQLQKQVLATRERILGSMHPDVAISLNNLAILYNRLSRDSDAENLLRRSLQIHEHSLGVDHPDTVLTLSYLATALQNQGKILQSETAFAQALAINERMLGPDAPATIRCREAYENLISQKIRVNSPNGFASTVVDKRASIPLRLPPVRGKRKSGKAKK